MAENKSVTPMKAAKTGYIIISVLLCLSGLALIIFPGISVSVIGIAAGILMILFGIVKIAGYFSKDLYRLAFQFDLGLGILLIILGVIVLFKSDSILNFLCTVLGIAVLADALFKIQISLDSKHFGIKNWYLISGGAVLTGIIGLLLIIRPGSSVRVMTVLMGISILIAGILNLCTVLIAVKIIKHQKPDKYEVIYEEE